MMQQTDNLLDLADYDIRQRWQRRSPKEFPSPWASEWGFDQYGLWQTFVVKGISQKMRFIADGSFLMGSPEDDPERFVDEIQHQVTLIKGFWLGETTITQQLWQAVTGDNPSEFKTENGDLLPVESVSYDDCLDFCQALNQLISGLKVTLPTEDQWEYACRAGTDTAFSTGNNLTNEQANFDEHYKGTVAVNRFKPNPWGLYQMHGNLWEWCVDGERDYTTQPQVDPQDKAGDDSFVLRGGSWFNNARNCRSAGRDSSQRDDRFSSIGLRVAQV